MIYDVGEPSEMTTASESRMLGGQEMERRQSLLIYRVNKIGVPTNYLESQIYISNKMIKNLQISKNMKWTNRLSFLSTWKFLFISSSF